MTIFCPKCKEIIPNDVLSMAVYNTKRECLKCTSMQFKMVSREEYEKMMENNEEEEVEKKG